MTPKSGLTFKQEGICVSEKEGHALGAARTWNVSESMPVDHFADFIQVGHDHLDRFVVIGCLDGWSRRLPIGRFDGYRGRR